MTLGEDSPPRFRTDVKTGFTFETRDEELQKLYDAATAKMNGNLVQFTPSMKVLVEGGGYANAWIETQPMGGEMFARHDVQVALNNQVVFMLGRRNDGRLPGMVIAGDTVIERGWDKNPREGYIWYSKHHLAASYEMFQGFCFPQPAWRMYDWAGRDRAYLRQLYAALEPGFRLSPAAAAPPPGKGGIGESLFVAKNATIPRANRGHS